MEAIKIDLPSIRDDDNGYSYLFRLAGDVMSDPKRRFIFNLSKCAILEQNAVVVLGGLARYIETQGSTLSTGITRLLVGSRNVYFLVDTMSSLIKKQLVENNFLHYFNNSYAKKSPIENYIGYREHDKVLDADEIALHLNEEWLSDSKLSVSPPLKQAVVGRIFEIFMNAYGHGVDTSRLQGLRAFSCGQYDKKEGLLKLSVLDFGIGIIGNVHLLHDSEIDDLSAMEWALVSGNSTRTDSSHEIPRGLGFELLNDFVTINKGSLKIYSNTCSAVVTKDGRYEVSKLKLPFNGTLVNITINCDDRHYLFTSETDEGKKYF